MGTSPTVERAVASANVRGDQRRRALRTHSSAAPRCCESSATRHSVVPTPRIPRQSADALGVERRHSHARGDRRGLRGARVPYAAVTRPLSRPRRSQEECRWPRRPHSIAPSMRSTRPMAPGFASFEASRPISAPTDNSISPRTRRCSSNSFWQPRTLAFERQRIRPAGCCRDSEPGRAHARPSTRSHLGVARGESSPIGTRCSRSLRGRALPSSSMATPARQDLDHTLAERAVVAGCHFALDSDAHTPRQLRYSETALAHARLAAVPCDRVVNCWPANRLLDWLSDRSSAST